MATYVLIHGSYQGSWIWKLVAPQLIAAGHVCFLVNLAGLARSYYRPRAIAAWDKVTEDRFAAEAKA